MTAWERAVIRATCTAIAQGALALATYELWAYLLAAMPRPPA